MQMMLVAAWETLGVPTKRRAYDSVDPQFDDDIPSNNQDNKDNFFAKFGPAFERNARSGSVQNIAHLNFFS